MGLRKLDTEGQWLVDSVPIYVPDANVSVTHSHLASEDSGRDEQGFMHINWLRTDVLKVGISYGAMTGPELEYMREMMQGKEFDFTFPNENSVKTFRGYTGEIMATLYSRFNGIDIYRDVKVNIIEL